MQGCKNAGMQNSASLFCIVAFPHFCITVIPMPFPYEEFDLSGVRTHPLGSRASKVHADDLARPVAAGSGVRAFLDALPNILSAADFKAVVAATVDAKRAGRGIVWGLGAHVIKTGLGPVFVDLMERGFVSAIAMNGATMIHDFELALTGATSEDVDEALGPGRFGMAEETGRDLNAAINDGVASGAGIGQAVSAFVHGRQPAFAGNSVLASAARLAIPVTVHVGVGTDIIHMHPAASGQAIGEGSLRDFRYFASSVARLEGGLYFNCGSAVLLPEVFLKAVALARNRGAGLAGLTTVNFDFVRQYRPLTNVVARPTAGIGKGYSFVGAHEIMLPLLAAALVEHGEGT